MKTKNATFIIRRGNHHYQLGVDKQEYRDWEKIGLLSRDEVECSLKDGIMPPGLWIETPAGIQQVWGEMGKPQTLQPINGEIRL